MAKDEQAAKKKPFIVIRDDLRQRDVTALELELPRIPGTYLLLPSAASRMAAYLKAAIGAGWIVAPPCEARGSGKERVYLFDGVDVDDMHPRDAYRAGKAVSDLMDEFTTVDPNS